MSGFWLKIVCLMLIRNSIKVEAVDAVTLVFQERRGLVSEEIVL